MTAPTIRNVVDAVEREGADCELHSDARHGSIDVQAPDGKSWACDPGVHTLSATWVRGVGAEHSGKAEALQDLLVRIAVGLVDCPSDCPCKDDPCSP